MIEARTSVNQIGLLVRQEALGALGVLASQLGIGA